MLDARRLVQNNANELRSIEVVQAVIVGYVHAVSHVSAGTAQRHTHAQLCALSNCLVGDRQRRKDQDAAICMLDDCISP